MTINIKEWLQEKSVTEVECLVSDISGIPRGKILPVHKYVSAIETGGLRLPEYVFGQSVTGEYYDSVVLNEIGADIVLRPDSETCRLVPWYEDVLLEPRNLHCFRAGVVRFGARGAQFKFGMRIWNLGPMPGAKRCANTLGPKLIPHD